MLMTKEFWTSTLERAIKTFAQTLLALVGTDAVGVLSRLREVGVWVVTSFSP